MIRPLCPPSCSIGSFCSPITTLKSNGSTHKSSSIWFPKLSTSKLWRPNLSLCHQTESKLNNLLPSLFSSAKSPSENKAFESSRIAVMMMHVLKSVSCSPKVEPPPPATPNAATAHSDPAMRKKTTLLSRAEVAASNELLFAGMCRCANNNDVRFVLEIVHSISWCFTFLLVLPSLGVDQ